MQPPPDLAPMFEAIAHLDVERRLLMDHRRKLKRMARISLAMAVFCGVCGVANIVNLIIVRWPQLLSLTHH